MKPDLARLLEDPARAADLSDEQARKVLVRISALLTALSARTGTAADENGRPEAPAEALQLLGVPRVAELLDLPKARIYELIRQGELPAARVGAKNVRVPYAALREWVARRQDKGVDTAISNMLTSSHDGLRGTPNPRTARAHAAPIRRAGRRSLRDGKPLGAGQGAGSGTGGPADPASSKGGTGRET